MAGIWAIEKWLAHFKPEGWLLKLVGLTVSVVWSTTSILISELVVTDRDPPFIDSKYSNTEFDTENIGMNITGHMVIHRFAGLGFFIRVDGKDHECRIIHCTL